MEPVERILKGPGDSMGQHETPGNDVDTRMAGILERMKKREQAAANADRKVIVVSDPNNCPLSVKTSCDCCKDGEYIDIQYNPEIAIYAYQTRECYRKMLAKPLFEKSKMVGNDFLETFAVAEYDRNNSQILAYLKKWKPGNGSVFITAGKDPKINPLGNGTGKSFALHCLANKLCTEGIDCICTSTQNFIEELKSGLDNRNHQAILQRYMNTTVLMLDEMGKEPYKTDWVPEILFRLIDFRGKTKKDIIIASNFDYMQLEAYYGSEMYGPSIVSRLGGMCGKAWVLGGPDRRLKEFTEEANFLTEEDI